jgi:hypothetical protein
MSTHAELLQHEVFETRAVERETAFVDEPTLSNGERYAEEQIRCLVRRVFFPGWPKPARQVVFSAVDKTMDISGICLQVGQVLAAQTSADTCVVEQFDNVPGRKDCEAGSGQGKVRSLRSSSRQIGTRLWLVPKDIFLGENELSAPSLRGRLEELRREFDYTVLQGPPAGMYDETALLGHLSDGVILVLEANTTRRATAQKVKETLQAANARLLGTVLSERTFPIPEGIYRKL